MWRGKKALNIRVVHYFFFDGIGFQREMFAGQLQVFLMFLSVYVAVEFPSIH